MYKSATCAMYKNTMVQNVQTMYYKFQKKKKKMTCTLVKIKSYATIPLSISFLGHERGSLWPSSLKTLKYSKCTSLIAFHLSLKTHLFRCTKCAYVALQNCPQITAFNTCILQIFHKFQAFPVTERHEILHHHFSS